MEFPIQDLLRLEREYTEIMEDYVRLEEVFDNVLDEMDFDRYDEDKFMYEVYLSKFIHIEQEICAFKKTLDSLRFKLLN